MTPSTALVTAGLAIAVALAIAALWRGSPRRRALGAALLLVNTGMIACDAAGVSIAGASIGPAPYALLIAAASAVAGAGILLRRRGARWLGLGLAAAGAVSTGLNLSQWMMAGLLDGTSWAMCIWCLGSLVVVTSLTGGDVAGADRLAAHEQVWTRRDPLVRWMRAATLSAIAATPMLLIYAWGQDHAVAQVKAAAPLLAGVLAVGALLGARGLVLGGVLLALGAVGLAAVSALAVWLAPADGGSRVAVYFLAFWVPAAACGLGCGVALALRAAGAAAPLPRR
ncbi:MAG TPA: hypothetical protein VKB80_17500 [Kofleriaceae bacterium]|nr:hypothetical protein [Kofleriaceae bacterium]